MGCWRSGSANRLRGQWKERTAALPTAAASNPRGHEQHAGPRRFLPLRPVSWRGWRRSSCDRRVLAHGAEVSSMHQHFAAIILGGTGQVGGAAVAALLAVPECREVVMVTRKPTPSRSRVRIVVCDTGAAD